MHEKYFPVSSCLILAVSLLGSGCTLPTAGPAGTEAQTGSATATEAITSKPTSLELFTSETCPHCQNTKREIIANGWDKALPLGQKPLEDESNQKLVVERAKTCRLPLDHLQVPMLWTGQRCLSGEEPIIGYLTQLSKLYETSTSTTH